MLKGVEQTLFQVLRYTYASISYRKLQHTVLFGLLFQHGPNHDFPPVGELDGVAEQVQQDLSDSGFVSDQLFRYILEDQEIHLDTFLVSIWRKKNDRILETVADVEKCVLRFQLSLFKF